MNQKGEKNRRVRSTRENLRSALIGLLEEKPVHQISVLEVTERADVSRGTFYLHFKDVYDMVDQLEDDIVRQVETVMQTAGESNADSLKWMFTQLMRFARDNRELWLVLTGPNSHSRLTEKIYAALYQRTNHNLSRMFDNTPEENAYMTAFVVHGAFAMCGQWLRDGAKEEPEILAEVLAQSIEASKAALARVRKK